MARPDLNLLFTLDVLLAEGSVARAARRLRLSPSAMSRALARLREATGDPLLVRAGRGLVPSPRALELRERVGQLVQDAEAALRPAEQLNLGQLDRTFTLRTSEGFVENFGARLLARVVRGGARRAPALPAEARQGQRATARRNRRSGDRRGGQDDRSGGARAGVVSRPLRRRRANGAPAERGRDHAPPAMPPARHIRVSRRGIDKGPIDDALVPFGLEREIVTIVGGFSAALALARASDLVASVPERHTGDLRAGMHSFALPLAIPQITVSLLWHPRLDGDPAHRWLRGCVREACADHLHDPTDMVDVAS